jgi:predicted RNA-binding protein with PIN domain
MSEGAVVPDEGPEEVTGEVTVPLPEPVRQRVVGLASDALAELTTDELPPALRPFARFAPARRARLAATPLAAALDSDAQFRQRVAARYRQRAPHLIEALEGGRTPPAVDPLEVAAAAYLVRPNGWADLLSSIAERLERETAASASGREAKTVEKLREQLADARNEARQERDRLRSDLATLKEENATLRRTLKHARDRAKAAEQRAEEEASAAGEIREQAAAEVARMEAELRRLRARLGEAESAAESARRTVREGRDQADIRLRLLVDTLVDAAQGLRRELALPPTQTRPADTVRASEPGAGSQLSGADAEASLEALLALPQVHLIVDGYNVTKTAWPTIPLETQRTRLVNAMGGLVAQTRAELTVVFDGANLDAVPQISVPRGVRVRFSPGGVTADDVIRELVAAEPAGRPVVVVSSDREIADSVRRSGARPVPASGLVRLMSRS